MIEGAADLIIILVLTGVAVCRIPGLGFLIDRLPNGLFGHLQRPVHLRPQGRVCSFVQKCKIVFGKKQFRHCHVLPSGHGFQHFQAHGVLPRLSGGGTVVFLQHIRCHPVNLVAAAARDVRCQKAVFQ